MTKLNLTLVLRKTEAGQIAIKERDRSVVPRARSFLIIVDGVKTGQELVKLSNDPAQTTDLLQSLMDAGLIETLPGAGSQATAGAAGAGNQPAPATAAAVPEAKPMDLKVSIKKATRYLESLMGPASEGLCIQLERCKSESDFLAKVSEVQRILAISRSEKKAAEFVAATLGP